MVGTIGNTLGEDIENFGEHIDHILKEKISNILGTSLGSD